MAEPSSSFSKILYPEWQNEFQAAIVELDREKLEERVMAAETAIFKRLQAIARSSDHSSEREAIQDALSSLRTLKRNELRFPDWEKK